MSDTHALIWWVTKARPLGKAAARAFRRAERGLDEIRVPAISVFEIGLLFERGRLRSRLGREGWLSAVESTRGIAVEPFGPADARTAGALPALVDPFDRMIAATALRLGAPLVTADERIRASGLVATVW